MSSRKIYVYADWNTLEAPTLMGVLSSDVVRGKEVFSFDYDRDWISNPEFRLLDPDLKQFTGAQYIYDEKPNFIAKSTFNNWAIKSMDMLKPLADELHKVILRSQYVNMDETTVKLLLKGKDKCVNAYVWGMTAPQQKLTYFHYDNWF